MAEKIELGEMIGAARAGLRHHSGVLRYQDFASLVFSELESRHLVVVPKSSSGTSHGTIQTFLQTNFNLHSLLSECFYWLHRHGYLVGAPSWPNPPSTTEFWVTDGGKEWLASGDPTPEDIKQYLKFLSTVVGGYDPVIK